jgi:subtilisin family serine protease
VSRPLANAVRLFLSVFVVFLFLMSGLGPAGITAAAQTSVTKTTTGKPLPAPGRVIVVMKESEFSAASDVAAASGVEPVHVYDKVLGGFSANVNTAELQALAKNPAVSHIVADRKKHLYAQTILTQIKRTGIDKYPVAAIDGSDNVPNVDVAILDTGIEYYHADLNVVGGYNCTSSDTMDYDDYNGHGTHAAGIAAARDNSAGIVGSAPGARLAAIRVLGADGSGWDSDIICGLNVVDLSGNPFDVVNLSLGGPADSSDCASWWDPLHGAVCDAVARGTTVVVAAGNDSDDAANYAPAFYPEAITVAAMSDYNGTPGGGSSNTCGGGEGADDSFASYSNYGSVVDIAAPGSCIYSTYLYGSYAHLSGTSMASPLVAGAAALYKAQNPGASPSQVRSWLLSDSASKPQSSSVGYTGGSTGSNRILYLGSAPNTTNPPGTTNPSFSGAKATITASASTPNTVPASYAHDNNFGTNWHSGHSTPSTASLRFDLGASKTLTGVRWKFYALGYSDSFTVKLYNAYGGEVASYGPFGNGSSSAWYGFTVPSTSAQYVRFFFSNPGSDSALGSMSEVEIWNQQATLPPGASNPTFAGAKATITNSASTPSNGLSPRSYDGNTGTNWNTGASTPSSASLRLDLGSAKNITGVKWKFATLGQADSFTVRIVSEGGTVLKTYGPYGNGTTAQSFYGVAVDPAIGARFVHFIFSNPNRDVTVGSISELEIWSQQATLPPGTTNPTFTGAKATITNSASTPNVVPAGYAHDNNLSSNWHSGHSTPSTASLRLDLGSGKSITGVKWKFYGLGYADSFTVKLFNASGTEVGSYGPFGNGTVGTNYYGFSVPSTSAQYVRFYFTNPNRDSAVGSIAEVEVWTVAPGIPPGEVDRVFGGSQMGFTNSADTPATGTSVSARDNNLATSWAISGTPASAQLRFDLGGNKTLYGIDWRFATVGRAPSFTVVLINTSGETLTFGPFGDGSTTASWYGVTIPGSFDARYVRFYFTNTTNVPVIGSIAEVRAWGDEPAAFPEDTEFAGMSLPIVESESTSGEPNLAHDGNEQTTFAASAQTQSTAVTFDLGGARELTGVRWKSAADNLVTISTSSDGESWTEAGTFANKPDAAIWQGTGLSGGTRARYVRVEFDGAGAEIAELEVWGIVEIPVASPDASPAASPMPVEIGTAETVQPTETAISTEPVASPEPVTATPTATETIEPTATETIEPTATPTETLEATATNEPTAEPTAAISLGTIVNTDGDAVNCRVTPVDGEPVTQVSEDDQVEITGETIYGWIPVICDGQAGWIAEQFVTLGAPDPTEEPGEATATATIDGEATEEVIAEPTEEPTAEPTEEVVEKPYAILDTGDTEDSGTAWLASDDDSSTYWSVVPNQSPEQTRIYFDLGAVVPIDRLTIELATWDQLPYFEIWLSEDAETWYNATPNGINGWNLDRDVPLEISLGFDARYVRIVIPNVDESGLGEVGGIRQVEFWPGDITQTQYLTALGEPTTPTPEPVVEEPTAEPTEEVVEEPTEEEVFEDPTEEVIAEPTEGDFVEEPNKEVPVEEPTEEEAVG